MSVTESLKNGAYHISNNTVEYNPVRRSNFSLVVPGLKNILRVGAADGSTDAADIIADGQAELILALKSWLLNRKITYRNYYWTAKLVTGEEYRKLLE